MKNITNPESIIGWRNSYNLQKNDIVTQKNY